MAQTKEKVSESFLASLPLPKGKAKSEKEDKYLREVLNYEFYNLEEPGLSIKFPYGSTKKKHNFTFFHGAKYRLPRFIAEFMDSRSTPIYDWRPDPEGTGRMTKQLVGHKPRFQMRQVYE